MNSPIGVFDSGIGGLTILSELKICLPNEDFIYFGDNKNVPYGTKSEEEIVSLSKGICDFLVSKNCKMIVVACNTATAAAIRILRNTYKIPIVGIEPAVKPACLDTKTGNIGVLATAGTFRGNLFKNTSKKYSEYVTIHVKVAKELVEFAEKSIFSGEEVENMIKYYFEDFFANNVDIVVLGCTHFAFFYESFEKIAGNKITFTDSAKAVARRTKDILMNYKLLDTEKHYQKIEYFSSGNIEFLKNIAEKYM